MKRTIIIGVISAGLIAFAPADAFAAREGKVHGSYINVRSDASHSANVVTKKLRGDKYTVEFEKDGWLKVSFDDGTNGWIFNSVVEKRLATDEESARKAAAPAVASQAAVPALPREVTDAGKPAGTKTEEKKPAKADEKVKSAEKAREADTKKEQAQAKVEEKAKDVVKAKDTQPPAPEKKKAEDKKAEEKKAEPQKAEQKKADVKKADVKKTDEKKAEPAKPSDLPPAKAVSTTKTASDYYHEAIALYEKKRYQEALDANRSALEQAPRNAEILNNIGNCLFKMGKIQDAISNWKEALKSAPKQAKICNNLGIAYYQIDENDRAVEFYKKAILFEPQFADAYYNLASVYGFKGQFRDALENYRKYLEFNPDATMKKLTEERIEYCQKQLNTPKKDKK